MKPDKPPVAAECVSVADAAIIAGISPSAVYELIRQQKFPFKRIGGRIVVQLKLLHAWLELPRPQDDTPPVEKTKPEPLCVTVADAAIMAGIGTATAYHLIKQHKFPFKRIGNRIVVPLKKLHEWIDSPEPVD
jgi:predicted DNA-binding transcriptional regulator AlpA